MIPLLHDPIALTKQLIKQASVTPDDKNCQQMLTQALKHLGFQIQSLPFGPVKNFWARYGQGSPLFLFAGHTDVVPPGSLASWQSPPFFPEIREGYLYGRGSADMKSSLAAMLTACYRFLKSSPKLKGSIAWLITSDEEGEAINGTDKVVDWLQKHNEVIDYCLIGEPSSNKKLGDTLRIGRRGSLNGWLTILGKQGHIAYPELAKNPIHDALSCLNALKQKDWNFKEDSDFPKTQFQLANLQSGTGATNVIPGELKAQFNFRYAPSVTEKQLKEAVHAILNDHGCNYELKFSKPSLPFKSPQGKLLQACKSAIQQQQKISPILSTAGGTSDGRFIARTGCELIELGPINASIHQTNECIATQDILILTNLYETIMQQLLQT